MTANNADAAAETGAASIATKANAIPIPTAAEPSQSRPESPPPPLRPVSTTIAEPDPNAYRITILLASSGYRTQISVNRALLEKSAIHDGDGFLVSQLKNALWKDWPSGIPSLQNHTLLLDWPEPLPPSPNFLRLIYAGKMLADKSTLSDYNIGPGRPNILHLSVRPADFVEDECTQQWSPC
jgi:hypothetical protein